MKWYAILFKYAGHWHMDIFPSEENDIQDIRQYLIEASRHSVERNKLQQDDFNFITESEIHEIRCVQKSDGSGAIVIENVPLDAVSQIKLIPTNGC